jgi:hypothetical protein
MSKKSCAELFSGVKMAGGKFTVELPDFGGLSFSPLVEIDGKTAVAGVWKEAGRTADSAVFTSADKTGERRMVFNAAQEDSGERGVDIKMEITLKKTPGKLSVAPLAGVTLKADHLLVHGRKMGGCKAFVLKAKKNEELFASHFMCMITHGDTSLRVSHPLRQDYLSSISGKAAGGAVKDLRAETVFDRPFGRAFVSEPLRLFASRDGHGLMTSWADANRKSVKKLPAPQESGWNSWDYYRWTVTEDEVLKNAEFIAADPVLSKHVKRIIVDDGWQYCYGEWDANSLFPSGMRSLAKKLSGMGFEPGLWFAPSVFEPHSRTAQLDEDMLAKGLSGLPCLAFECMRRKGFVIDPTVERSRKWLHGLFKRYSGYGYKYFKLDFLASTLNAPLFADPAVPRGQIIRMIVETVRRAAGSGRQILGCNYNFEAGADLPDCVRVSSDIHSSWKSVKSNAVSVAARFWSHRRLWINDPDFAVCRGPDTSSDPNMGKLKPCLVFVEPGDAGVDKKLMSSTFDDIRFGEAEILLGIVIMSGGAMNLSDNLPALNEKGLALLRRAVSAEKGDAAVPLDLFRSENASLWLQKLDSGAHRLMLVNWDDKASEIGIDLKKHNLHPKSAVNFWRGGSVPVKNGVVSAALPPRSCLLAELR